LHNHAGKKAQNEKHESTEAVMSPFFKEKLSKSSQAIEDPSQYFGIP